MYKSLQKYENKTTTFAMFLKLAYSFGLKTWVHGLISALSGIFTSLMFEWGYIVWGIVLTIITLLDIIYSQICHDYSKKRFEDRKFASEILEGEASLINSIYCLIQTNPSWNQSVFKTVSQLVCDRLHETFKNTFSCDTRISVEFVFDKEIKNGKVQYFQMSGRNSKHVTSFKKAVKSEERKQYYSYKIFINNNLGVNILRENDICNSSVWHKNPANNTKVKQYIGIAVSANTPDSVDFILQIDCLDEMIFGKNNTNDDIYDFVNKYILTYVNTLKLAYMLGLNRHKKISEVH